MLKDLSRLGVGLDHRHLRGDACAGQGTEGTDRLLPASPSWRGSVGVPPQKYRRGGGQVS
jgi:hypothetical protein